LYSDDVHRKTFLWSSPLCWSKLKLRQLSRGIMSSLWKSMSKLNYWSSIEKRKMGIFISFIHKVVIIIISKGQSSIFRISRLGHFCRSVMLLILVDFMWRYFNPVNGGMNSNSWVFNFCFQLVSWRFCKWVEVGSIEVKKLRYQNRL
jgi:hypothetical protein